MDQRTYSLTRPLGVRLVLLVLSVLTGLVAMHGPTTVGLPGWSHDLPATGHAMPLSAMASDGPHGSGGGECAHAPHETGDHPGHADPACAAGGTSGPPTLPALVPTPAAPRADASATQRAPADSLGSRAPPSLSELQLLRI